MKRFRELALACGAIAALISMSLINMSLNVQATSKRLITLDDLSAVHQVSEPQISRDGAWIAYTVRSVRQASLRVAIARVWDCYVSLR
ncbi:MAG: hypothetical protein V7L11_24760 [Nostoc sp.]|uniref:hypothetical protein n=1 Tax=Nostoc sp. TaxID=1180 RepID=UPI002FF525BD